MGDGSDLPFFSVLINLHRWMALDLYSLLLYEFSLFLVTILRIDAIKFSSPLSLWPFLFYFTVCIYILWLK